MSIYNNEKKSYQHWSVSLGRFHKHDPKTSLLSGFKVSDSSRIMHEAEWIIECIFKKDKRLGESDNLSAGDKLSEWIRDEKNKSVC